MSESEIKMRQAYKRNRKKWTIIQIVALVLLTAIALGSFLIYDRMNRTYYIEYTESSSIDYKVQYKENEFFEEEWLGEDREYISSLINTMIADFHYNLNMDTAGVGFEYKYKIDATLLIADKDSGKAYRTVTETLFPPTNASVKRSNSVSINETVSIDYNKFNAIATEFTTTYGLKNASSTLIITLDVEVLSSSEQFRQNNENRFSTSLKIPLVKETFGMEITSSVPESESKVLAYSGAENQSVFLILGITLSSLAFLLLLVLFVFLHITRNEDITYTARVRKLLKSYGSYIQRMNGEFCDEGYQTVLIKSFTEMLGIRDTIQSPILMSENRDETMSRFLIPTNTKILYIFEIKVDNYDEIYNTASEEPIILEENDPEAVAVEAMAQPDEEVVVETVSKTEEAAAEDTLENPADEGVVWPERFNKKSGNRYDPKRRKSPYNSKKNQDFEFEFEQNQSPIQKILGAIKRKTEDALRECKKYEK
ncbi:MAG: hypothetical protein IJW49_11465 [Clostridia bacterium]|nr:hypothetical protein [Clostridia bacterium]